ncbi:emp24p/erv25p- protein [Agyrium rufum]|nr:emp24p/erv25p- protein [Agyrium rufum]
MAQIRSRPSGTVSTTLLTLLTFLTPLNALYFFMETTTPKCFYEELPKDTLVVGNYKAEQYVGQINAYARNPETRMLITVDQVFDADHRVVNQKGDSTGRFTFTAAESGDHKICLTPSQAAQGGWLSAGAVQGGLKVYLDLAIGETSQIESSDKGKITDIVAKVKDLNGRLQDIRREQVFQRVRTWMDRRYRQDANERRPIRNEKPSFEINLKAPTQG